MLKSSPKLLGGAVAVVALATAFTSLDGSSARAQSTQPIYSGGSTLAEAVYRDLFNCYGSTSAVAPSLGTTSGTGGCATTPINPNAEVLYAGVGSGAGQNAYTANNPASYGTPTAGAVPWTSGDFPGYPYTGVAFSGSDATLSPAQVTTEQSLGFGPAIQIPSLVTSINVAFNPATSTSDPITPATSAPVVAGVTGTSGLMLSRNNLCGIFSGAITDWSDTRLGADNGVTSLTVNPETIKVTYREDSSGTTFLFSQALVAQCGVAGTATSGRTPYPMPNAWGTAASTKYFTNARSSSHPLPANFYSETALDGGTETGTPGIADAVGNNAYVIGYISPDYAAPLGVSPHPAPVSANVANSTGAFIPPGIATSALIMVNATPPSVADANAFATAGSNADPAGANTYPIGGFTWIELYSCYASSTVVQDLVSPGAGSTGLVKWLVSTYSTEQTGLDVPEIMGNNGFSPIPDSWKVKIRAFYFNGGATSHIGVAPRTGICASGAVAS